ncbi:iron chelate uptake ABC transporter family permease subunit [Allokutzneria sp. A3M-2-11 16]|uniref:FecCD family ABC transporter permease n=1 Tax=Allokutzneria sp. A3M-2-11 16 TaxID=2962043 RepID=UPI0020B807D4|nr:iron chelate uptake ABC transporter family permease subunit [Allokutzneria sp. A3M-2-11 16]MCP3800625.1 iron chelate uptake ABC transporter family permease subunit [Allokutzneria sp. A3M-2-11 16]
MIIRFRAVSLRVHPRSVTVVITLLLLTFVLAAISMTTGDFPLSVSEVVRTVLGFGDPATEFIVNRLRLPRVLIAILVGAALALSGAVLQSLTRNPLGSPDFIGFAHGSATGALIVILLFQGSMAEISLGALAGGMLTAALAYLLAFRRGVQGFRLVLIGIGLSAMLLAANNYLVTRASLTGAIAAQTWITGTLNGRTWNQVVPLLIALALLLPPTVYFGQKLALLELGDDKARALGVPVEITRLALLAISVTLAAVATAAAGPIAFVALTAPQLARKLTAAPGSGLTAAAATGALLLVAGDLAVQRLFASPLPVGILTSAIGGTYLAWLLVREWRRGRL